MPTKDPSISSQRKTPGLSTNQQASSKSESISGLHHPALCPQIPVIGQRHDRPERRHPPKHRRRIHSRNFPSEVIPEGLIQRLSHREYIRRQDHHVAVIRQECTASDQRQRTDPQGNLHLLRQQRGSVSVSVGRGQLVGTPRAKQNKAKGSIQLPFETGIRYTNRGSRSASCIVA